MCRRSHSIRMGGHRIICPFTMHGTCFTHLHIIESSFHQTWPSGARPASKSRGSMTLPVWMAAVQLEQRASSAPPPNLRQPVPTASYVLWCNTYAAEWTQSVQRESLQS